MITYLPLVTTLEKVRQTIETHNLLEKGQGVLVALSGGPDSVALLHVLWRLRKTYRLTLAAVYVNHQIRPRAAKREERFCQGLCDNLGVPLTVMREDVPTLAKKRRLGIEETAREVRYGVFARLAESQRFDRVALGHQADDQVETILFRLVRGTGPSGLAGMPYRRGPYIRPLLDLTRSEILSYLEKQHLSWCEDVSNRSLKYRRNWIRHKLLPEIRRNLNPQADSAIRALADTIRDEDEFLEGMVARAARRATRITPGGKIELACAAFRTYAKWKRRRLLRYCLKVTCPGSYGPDKEALDRLDGLAMTGTGTLTLPNQVRAAVAGETLYVWRKRAESVQAAFEPGRRLELNRPRLTFAGNVRKRSRKVMPKQRGANCVVLDWDRLAPPLEVRSARPGDRFQPLGMKGHKKVGDFLTDRKVPRPLRDEILLLCDQHGPVWIVGQEIADRAKVDDKTRRTLTVAVSVRKKTGGSTV
ncbi:MAG: tRNA lysidine(34) synthetase TilS [Candidatus Zixiibacteriota bacterium]